jgi:hypothetical protein
MGNIGGKKREQGEYVKKVGLFAANVIAVNPTEKEYKDILGMELKEDSKAAEYLGERDGNTMLRIDFWLENTKKNADGEKDRPVKVTFFLEDKGRLSKDENKKQYINAIGSCAWAEDENSLPEWFTKRDYREAYAGEEDLFEFMRAWLNKLDYREAETTLALNWKKLMKGDVKEIREQINGEWAGEVGCMATISTKTAEDGEIKEYQGVYNRGFFPIYTFKHFRVVDYDNEDVQKALKDKPTKDLKPYERFVLKVIGEYGCKDFYKFKDLKEYDSSENVVATDAPITDGGAEY